MKEKDREKRVIFKNPLNRWCIKGERGKSTGKSRSIKVRPSNHPVKAFREKNWTSSTSNA